MNLSIPTLIACLFSIAAIVLSYLTVTGCDIVQLHFEALNDRGIYFHGSPKIGLGFSSHEQMKGKNSMAWVNDSSCYEYDDNDFDDDSVKGGIEKEAFLSGELNTAREYFTSGSVLGSISTIFLCVGFVYTLLGQSKAQKANIILFIGAGVGIISFSFQLTAYTKISLHEGICDRDRYFPTGWYEDYPLFDYPDYKYMKYFARCEFGETAKLFLGAILLQLVTLFLGVAVTAAYAIRSLRASQHNTANDDDEYASVHTFPLKLEDDNKEDDYEENEGGSIRTNTLSDFDSSNSRV